MKTSTLTFLAFGGAFAACSGTACGGNVVVDNTGGSTTAHASASSTGGPFGVTSGGGAVGGGGGSPPSTGADTTAGSSTSNSSSTTAGNGGAGSTVASTAVSTASSTVATSSSTGAGGTGGAPVTCTPAEQAMVWQAMDQQPIELPDHVALLDLMGLTVQGAEQILCQGTMLGDAFGDGSGVEAWGASEEVWLDYAIPAMTANMVTLWPGYLGALDFLSADGTHGYRIALNVQVMKDGGLFQLDWGDTTLFDPEVDELYRALSATFGAPEAPGTTCLQSGDCTTGTFGDVGFIYFKTIGIGVWVASVSQPQPTPSIPNRLDIFPL